MRNKTLQRVLLLSIAGLPALACAPAGELATLSTVATVSHAVPANVVDTVVLNATISAVVDTRGSTGVDVSLRSASQATLASGATVVAGVVLGLAPSTAVGSLLRTAGTARVTIEVAAPTVVTGATRNVGLQDASNPLAVPIWAVANQSSFTDPHTGKVVTTSNVDLTPNTAATTETLIQFIDAIPECDLQPRLIDVDGSRAAPDAAPLVLIHGWQWWVNNCVLYHAWDVASNRDPFDSLIGSLNAQPDALRSRYHLYVMHYPTFTPVIKNGLALNSLLAALPGGPPVLVAHSMGGLVARAALDGANPAPIRGLITLATPHEGAPAAAALSGVYAFTPQQLFDFRATCQSYFITGLGIDFAGALASPFLVTNGMEDLSPSSPIVQLLLSNHASGPRLFTIGGFLPITAAGDAAMRYGACITAVVGNGASSDGIVPISSAIPTWTAGEQLIGNTDHTQLPSSAAAAAKIVSVLSRWSHCGSDAPPSLASDFPISATISRRSADTVDIALNGIVINGIPQTNIPLSAYTIVENDCTIPASDVAITTSQSQVPIDVAFIQDLSGSMDSAIAGVRNSVAQFATSLANRGFDVRFGSVGYSGTVSTIPSTPSGSPYERIGPVQDFTTAAQFQDFVSRSWQSNGGGDAPENGLEAIEYAAKSLSWRPAAARVIIDITNSSHHVAGDSCKGGGGTPDYGACTDETLSSIVALLGGQTIVHVVAPSDVASRTQEGGLDPWLLATATGGKTVALGNGIFDLTTLGLTDALAATTRLTFTSASTSRAPENLRLLVRIGSQTGQFTNALPTYIRRQ